MGGNRKKLIVIGQKALIPQGSRRDSKQEGKELAWVQRSPQTLQGREKINHEN